MCLKDDFDFANFVKDDGSIMTMEEVERIHIKRALDQNNWNRENTARALRHQPKNSIF